MYRSLLLQEKIPSTALGDLQKFLEFPPFWPFKKWFCKRVRVMEFDAAFSNISAISLRSVLLVEETGVP
jgi:hypothetical protein